MNYLIAVLGDRIQAEEAYTALEKAGLTTKQVSILGRGYKSADEFGLIDPKLQAQQQALRMIYWLAPFGFVAGFGFNVVTGLDTFPWAGTLGNQIIGGIFGAIAGMMGGFFVGGGVGLVGSGDALPYRNRLDAGKYLIVVQGTDSLTSQATKVLKKFNPESIQGYQEEG
ncbi:MAG: hypothetical protein HC916_16435 [Coleofasciculaceae cyanobacterium SM2_1_6]|nr:hypothetical protein [Coleofasciculaceae cyanobacterium SM2_1_6]